MNSAGVWLCRKLKWSHMAYALSTNKQWQCPLTYIRHRRISFRQGQSLAVFFIPDYKNGHDFFLAVPLLFPSFLLNYCKNVTEKQRLNVKKCIFFFYFLTFAGYYKCRVCGSGAEYNASGTCRQWCACVSPACWKVKSAADKRSLYYKILLSGKTFSNKIN